MTQTTKPTIDRVNIYRAGDVWCYAAISGDEHDHSDTIDVEDGATDVDAHAEMTAQFPGARIVRVADVSGEGR